MKAAAILLITAAHPHVNGGGIAEIAARVAEINRLEQRVEIVAPRCASACTMYLGAADVCVSPETMFVFHGPRWGRGWWAPRITGATGRHWAEEMARHYPSAVAAYFMARWDRPGRWRLTGRWLVERAGVAGC